MKKQSSISNRPYTDISVGEEIRLLQTLSQRDANLLSVLSGNCQVLTGWLGILLSRMVETRLPGPGTVPLALNLRISGKIVAGMTVEVLLKVAEKKPPDQVVMDCRVLSEAGAELALATLIVRAPTERMSLPCIDLPQISINEHSLHAKLMARCAGLRPLRTAIVHPCDAASLGAALDAAKAGLIEPILVGPSRKMRAVAADAGFNIEGYRMVDAAHSHAAAEIAVLMGNKGEVEAIMKGSLHTDELMQAVLREKDGLRTDRRVSHVYLFDVPGQDRLLFITDAAINIAPSLNDKRDICRNAIELAKCLGVATPKVAILAAVETVTERMPATVDAAALCKMAERGQISGALLDGPLAFDNAISPEAARLKGIQSAVAGQADILLVPDIEAGNMLAKQLTHFNGADGAGIVLGARLPIILASRADPASTRIASCAIALLVAQSQRSTA
jgi:phosphate acetyltransferase